MYVILLVLVILMAKRNPKRKFRKYLRGGVDETLALTTLAATTLVSAVFDETVSEKAWLSSIKASWTLSNFTPGANIGPILVGIAHSDYTDAEIEAWVEQSSSWNEADLVGQEVVKRKIRMVGMFGTAGASDAPAWMALANGKPIRTKCGWMLNTGQTLRQWAYNTGSQAVATTVPIVKTEGHANLWPR